MTRGPSLPSVPSPTDRHGEPRHRRDITDPYRTKELLTMAGRLENNVAFVAAATLPVDAGALPK
ncbi:hypothetical protein EV378_6043 [Pseudonocardia endophytica]|uniref:Uncharacterized protein n=1 Tax=Pseudonocardia endophytica TaxID=401976 RepID=A0A4V2PHT9_PSEEN|nr:hypothetical protein EV378_6043 [Pseudonocardia endophytica]